MNKTIIATLLAGLVSFTAQASEWGYGDHNGPEDWGKISQTCALGRNQSPINITDAVAGDMQDLSISYSGKVTGLKNNGHTLQAIVEGHNVLNVDGHEFELKQFHFHTPSENLIKSKQYPLEAHFVHADKDGNLAVVAVMFEVNSENAEIAKLSADLPEEGNTVTLKEAFNIADLLPSYESYYRFNGSLTTPPCSEGVRWFVLNETKSISATQEKALNKMMGNNNRPVQDIWARRVMFSK
ncbi:carbonic anhydrase [Vibrio hannami]|uniref:carbonic anhydrase n=1 Tax=Vibrio hannami TaxID=2717094 RepID=UPI00240F1610|nr:carbonic anhydrase [Vibrio hannami]MDG3086195.1 carbonic anhydrase [Vibrio hannami]